VLQAKIWGEDVSLVWALCPEANKQTAGVKSTKQLDVFTFHAKWWCRVTGTAGLFLTGRCTRL